jgi:hypothetical protein
MTATNQVVSMSAFAAGGGVIGDIYPSASATIRNPLWVCPRQCRGMGHAEGAGPFPRRRGLAQRSDPERSDG